MRIYRLTYEEIDTEDRFNQATNTKITCQQAISEYELAMLYPKYDREYISEAKDKLFRKIRTQI